MHVYVCRAYIRGWGRGMFEDKCVHINIVCFDVDCFSIEYEMYMPRAYFERAL